MEDVVVSSFGLETEGVARLEIQPVPDVREARADGETASRQAEGSVEPKHLPTRTIQVSGER